MTIEQALQKVLGFGPKEFIEKALEGGWKPISDKHRVNDDYGSWNLEAILLDPLAWQAIGRQEEWEMKCYICKKTEKEGHSSICSKTEWDERVDNETPRWYMHRMIDALCEPNIP